MIDTHCHIDLYPNPTQIADRADRAGVVTVLVTNLPSAFERAVPYVRQFSRIRLALGLHPLVAIEHRSERHLFSRLIRETHYVGEIGLDFSPDGLSTKAIQIESFNFALRCLSSQRKFITLHSRRAEMEVLRLLDDSQYPHPVVFHWYTGSITDLIAIESFGHYFSVNPAMIRSATGKRVIEKIPPERILTESDGPFVEKFGKAVEPKDVVDVERYLAALWSVSSETVRVIIRQNFTGLVSPDTT